jgi:hypothetical protein
MKINAKYVLSGLTGDEIKHPTAQKIIDYLLDVYDKTGNGITTIRWIEETYGLKLVA